MKRATIFSILALALLLTGLAITAPASSEAQREKAEKATAAQLSDTVLSLQKDVALLEKQVKALRDANYTAKQDSKEHADSGSKLTLISPKGKRSMLSLAALSDDSAGLWCTGATDKGRNTGAVVGFERDPYLAVYDANRKTDGMAHQVAITIQEGRPVMQVAPSAVSGERAPRPVKFIDLYNLALLLEWAERRPATFDFPRPMASEKK